MSKNSCTTNNMDCEENGGSHDEENRPFQNRAIAAALSEDVMNYDSQDDASSSNASNYDPNDQDFDPNTPRARTKGSGKSSQSKEIRDHIKAIYDNNLPPEQRARELEKMNCVESKNPSAFLAQLVRHELLLLDSYNPKPAPKNDRGLLWTQAEEALAKFRYNSTKIIARNRKGQLLVANVNFHKEDMDRKNPLTCITHHMQSMEKLQKLKKAFEEDLEIPHEYKTLVAAQLKPENQVKMKEIEAHREASLKTESELVTYVQNIRKSIFGDNLRMNMTIQCLRAIRSLNITNIMLYKHPQVVNFFRKLLLFNGSQWFHLYKTRHTKRFVTWTLDVNRYTEEITNKFISILYPDDPNIVIESFFEIYAKDLDKFNKETAYLSIQDFMYLHLESSRTKVVGTNENNKERTNSPNSSTEDADAMDIGDEQPNENNEERSDSANGSVEDAMENDISTE